MHWQLDVSFREDAARNRKDNAPGTIAVLRRRALDVVRQAQVRQQIEISGWMRLGQARYFNGLGCERR